MPHDLGEAGVYGERETEEKKVPTASEILSRAVAFLWPVKKPYTKQTVYITVYILPFSNLKAHGFSGRYVKASQEKMGLKRTHF